MDDYTCIVQCYRPGWPDRCFNYLNEHLQTIQLILTVCQSPRCAIPFPSLHKDTVTDNYFQSYNCNVNLFLFSSQAPGPQLWCCPSQPSLSAVGWLSMCDVGAQLTLLQSYTIPHMLCNRPQVHCDRGLRQSMDHSPCTCTCNTCMPRQANPYWQHGPGIYYSMPSSTQGLWSPLHFTGICFTGVGHNKCSACCS